MAIMWGVKVPQTEVQSVRSEALYLPPSVASNRPDPPLFRRRLELGWGGGGHDLDPYHTRHTKPPPILLGTAAVESRSLSTARGNFNARNRHQPKLGEDTPSETFSVSDCQRLVTQHITNMGLW